MRSYLALIRCSDLNGGSIPVVGASCARLRGVSVASAGALFWLSSCPPVFACMETDVHDYSIGAF